MNNPPEPYSPERHSAWLDSLSLDELQIIHTPPGYLMHFIVAARTKRALQRDDLKVGDRLGLLERLNGLTDHYFSSEMLALVDPMSDTEYAIFKEARSLDSNGANLSPAQRTAASYKVLTSPRVFWHIFTLNAGIANAIRSAGPRYSVTSNRRTAAA